MSRPTAIASGASSARQARCAASSPPRSSSASLPSPSTRARTTTPCSACRVSTSCPCRWRRPSVRRSEPVARVSPGGQPLSSQSDKCAATLDHTDIRLLRRSRRAALPNAGRREDSGLRSPRFIAGMSLVLALIAVAVAIAALVVALNANRRRGRGRARYAKPECLHRGRGGPGYPLLPGIRLGRNGGILPHPMERRRDVARVHGEPRRPIRREPGPRRCSATASGAWGETTGATAGATSKSPRAGDGCTRMPGTRSPGGPRSATRGSCATTASCSARPGTSRGLVHGAVDELAIALDQSAASS